MKRLAWFLSFSVGFLSISQEILWVRVVGFLFETLPQSFSFVLGMFLAGIAVGAVAGKKVCQRFGDIGLASGLILLVAGLFDLALVALVQLVVASPFGLPGLGMLIILSAMLKGTVFPVAHQLGSVPGTTLGRSVSRVYFMNIAGSTLGPLVTGLVLLDVLSVTASLQVLSCGTLGVAAVALGTSGVRARARPVTAVALLTGLGVAVLAVQIDRRDPALIKALLGPDVALKHVIENRHGIIHVVEGGALDDTVYGGNVYDGRTSLDLRANTNRIDRAYLLAGLHPKPRRILMIGLSSGAWARVLSSHPDLERMEVVEINPGYTELIRVYPQLAPLINDPRVLIHFDDGRRWLRQQPEARFDIIIMNTTFHWRANVTNLVSREMQEMVRSHLNPGGIFAFNATGSDDIFYTASQVFRHAYRYRNFIYASDHDFRVPSDRMRAELLRLRLDGVAIFDVGKPGDMAAIDRLLAIPWVEIQEVELKSSRPLETVTDRNMITEFKYGRSLF